MHLCVRVCVCVCRECVLRVQCNVSFKAVLPLHPSVHMYDSVSAVFYYST